MRAYTQPQAVHEHVPKGYLDQVYDLQKKNVLTSLGSCDILFIHTQPTTGVSSNGIRH